MSSSVQQLVSWILVSCLIEVIHKGFSYLLWSLLCLVICSGEATSSKCHLQPFETEWSFYPCVRNLAQKMFKMFLRNETLVFLLLSSIFFLPPLQCSWLTFSMSHLSEQAFHLFYIMKLVKKSFVVCCSEICFFTFCNISSSEVCYNRSSLREASRAILCIGQIILQLLFGKISVPNVLS